jgi:3-oxoacyl-ACP reductase-like protein
LAQNPWEASPHHSTNDFARKQNQAFSGMPKSGSMFDLTGQAAIVTGAATGIGEAIAERLSRAGALVVIADLNIEAANTVAARLGGRAFAVKTDVAQLESI